MYSDPKSVDMYAKKIHKPVELIKESIKRFHPKSALQTDHFADLDGTVRDAVKLKFLTQPLTMEQLAELIQIPPEKK
jgi:NitT/TauT family transport system substrate-binding protein